MIPPPLPTAPAPGSTALVTLLGWAFILIGVVGLPFSLISGAMFITRSEGTQHADAPGLLTVVLGPAAVLVCGIGLLRHWSWAWWGAVLLAVIVFGFSLHAWWKPAAFLIAAAAVALVVWLRGGVHYRNVAPADPAPPKLDTFDGKPPQVPQPKFHLPGRSGNRPSGPGSE